MLTHRIKIWLLIRLCRLGLWRPLYNELSMEILRAIKGTGDLEAITRAYMQCPGIYIGAIIMLSDVLLRSSGGEEYAKQLLRIILPSEQVP